MIDLWAKKYTVLMGNEPITIWIKNGQIKKSVFMENPVALNLDSEAIAIIRDQPTKILQADTLKNSENFKYETSKMLSSKLELAIAKGDKKTMSRFARSELVPENMKENFIEAINAPTGLRKILKNAIDKTNSIFASYVNKINKFFDRITHKVVNQKLDKYLDEYQLKEFNKAPPLEDLDLSKNVNPKLADMAQEFIQTNGVLEIGDTQTKDKNLQNLFYTQTALMGYTVAEAKLALFKTVEQNQMKTDLREQTTGQTKALDANATLQKQIEQLQAQIANFEKLSKTSISNNTLINFKKMSLGMTQSEKIDLLVENEEYLSLSEEDKSKVENEFIFEPEQEKITLQEKGEEIGAIAKELQSPQSAEAKVEATERADEILADKRSNFVNEQNEYVPSTLAAAAVKVEAIVKEEHKAANNVTARKERYTQQDLDVFKKQTTTELQITDPKSILDDLGIEYKEIGNDSYQMNIRGEKTPSAYISLRNGEWQYKDFGADKGGNIVNVVMDYTGKDFKSSLDYSLQKLGVENRLETALSTHKLPSNQQDFKNSLESKREENQARATSVPISKVTKSYEISTNQMAVDYLAARGITKIPPQMKIINGEYTNKAGDHKKAYGVGVMTHDGQGADIHFLKKLGDMKTMSLGAKQPSFFKNGMSDKAIIFESKMDYAAAYQQNENLHADNIFIANGVTNAAKIGELIQTHGISSLSFYNQNDKAGYEFVANTATAANIQSFQALKYDVLAEYKSDVNDLLLNQPEKTISDRFTTQTIDEQHRVVETLRSLEANQKAIQAEKQEREARTARQAQQKEQSSHKEAERAQ